MSFAMIEDYGKRIETDEEIELEKSRNYYKAKCNDLKSEIKKLEEEHECKLMAERRMYADVVEQKDNEIKWLKDTITGILQKGK